MSCLSSVKVTVFEGNLKYEDNIIDDLIVGENDIIRQSNINQNMDEVSARIAFWGAMWAEAKRSLEISQLLSGRAKEDHDLWFVQIKSKASEGKELKSEKAKEEKAMMDNLEDYQKRIKDIRDTEDKVVEKQYNVNLIKIIHEAFEAKKDMLISLSSNLRSDMEPEIIIKKWNNDKLKKLKALIDKSIEQHRQ